MDLSRIRLARLSSLLSVLALGCALLGASTARADTTGVTGSSSAFNNAQPTLAVRWMIATSGLFPPRDGGLESSPYLGEIRPFAFTTPDMSGWTPCDGRLLAILSNQALFSVLGTAYGGDGRTNFALPDLRGRIPVAAGLATGLTSRTVGETGGTETSTMVSSNLPSHVHALAVGSTGLTGSGTALGNFQPFLAITMCLQSGGQFTDLGWVRFFAGSFSPGGLPLCNGTQLSAGQYPELYAVLGNTYGGDATVFQTPNLAARTPIGTGQGAGLTNRTLGASGGSETITLTTATIPAHTHTITGGNTGSTGGNGAHDTLQPFFALTWSIALEGLYGSSADQPALGELRLWAAPTLPTGWLACSGDTLSIDANQALYSLLGVNFGGDGLTTFNAPDARGRALAGVGTGSGLTARAIGDRWGAESVTLTTAQLAAHAHTYVAPNTAPTVTTPTSASIAATSATLGGNITADGGATLTERGVVYAVTGTNSDPQIGGAGVTKVAEGGTSTGTFAANVTGLAGSTAYSFKAYATNGVGTGYSSAGTFTTPAADTTAPTVVSVIRQSPVTQVFDGSVASVTFRVTYSEPVTNVSAANFAVQGVNGGTVAGTIGVAGTDNTATRDVTVTITGGTGEFTLKVLN